MDFLLKVNDTIWGFFYFIFRHIYDHPAFLLTVFAAYFAVFSLIVGHFVSVKYKKGQFTSFFIFEGIGLFTSQGMLMHLPVLHTRIHTALSTASSIIMSSPSYKDAFQYKSGFCPDNTADIVYYLWYLSPKEMEKLTILNPSLLYEKVYKTFMEERYLFGYLDADFIDGKIYFYLLLAAVTVLLSFIIRNGFSYPSLFCFLQFLILCGTLLFFKNGVILFMVVYIFCEMIMHSFLETVHPST